MKNIKLAKEIIQLANDEEFKGKYPLFFEFLIKNLEKKGVDPVKLLEVFS